MAKKQREKLLKIDENDIKILIICEDTQSAQSHLKYVEKKGWVGEAYYDLGAAVMYIIKERPHFILISFNFSIQRVVELPKILPRSFGAICVGFSESLDAVSMARLAQAKYTYKLQTGLSGPALERAIKRILMNEEERLQSEAKPSVEKAFSKLGQNKEERPSQIEQDAEESEETKPWWETADFGEYSKRESPNELLHYEEPSGCDGEDEDDVTSDQRHEAILVDSSDEIAEDDLTALLKFTDSLAKEENKTLQLPAEKLTEDVRKILSNEENKENIFGNINIQSCPSKADKGSGLRIIEGDKLSDKKIRQEGLSKHSDLGAVEVQHGDDKKGGHYHAHGNASKSGHAHISGEPIKGGLNHLHGEEEHSENKHFKQPDEASGNLSIEDSKGKDGRVNTKGTEETAQKSGLEPGTNFQEDSVGKGELEAGAGSQKDLSNTLEDKSTSTSTGHNPSSLSDSSETSESRSALYLQLKKFVNSVCDTSSDNSPRPSLVKEIYALPVQVDEDQKAYLVWSAGSGEIKSEIVEELVGNVDKFFLQSDAYNIPNAVKIPWEPFSFGEFIKDRADAYITGQSEGAEINFAIFLGDIKKQKFPPSESRSDYFRLQPQDISTQIPVKFRVFLNLKKNDKAFPYLKEGSTLSERQQKNLIKTRAVILVNGKDQDKVRAHFAEDFIKDLLMLMHKRDKAG